jgi:hypothetical protein
MIELKPLKGYEKEFFYSVYDNKKEIGTFWKKSEHDYYLTFILYEEEFCTQILAANDDVAKEMALEDVKEKKEKLKTSYLFMKEVMLKVEE